MKTPTKEEIFKRREDIEEKFSKMLAELKSDFSLEDIKEIIYNEEDQDDLMKIIAMFDAGHGLIELENVLELVNDAWNYFPHKCLRGLCPMEKLSECH